MVLIKVNWYKSTGKWYASEELNVPDHVSNDGIQKWVEDNQTQLQSTWVNGDYYVSITALYQASVDTRFFERLYKYGDVR